MSESKLIVLAVGGNSLITDKSKQSVEDQYEACLETTHHIVPLLKAGHRMVIAHGNGPQVGFILRRAELASEELHMVPFPSAGADTQGAIGYQLQQSLGNNMNGWDGAPAVATVVTQVEVDANDPGFANPSKPIGTFMDKELAEKRRDEMGWKIKEDSGRGFRRVVASPKPVRIVELAAIKQLVDAKIVTIAVGGGGIPVVADEAGNLSGADAVIDKDFASCLLAHELNADMVVISTAVEKVELNFNTPEAKAIDRMTVAEAKAYVEEGHFAPGSMLPKIQALIGFLESGGKEAIITDPAHLSEAMAGKTGTRMVP